MRTAVFHKNSRAEGDVPDTVCGGKAQLEQGMFCTSSGSASAGTNREMYKLCCRD
jgi:hypothetical protein